MKKINKKIIIIFSLILSILFLNISNISGVYCDSNTDFESKSFNYNLFNPNLLPFFTSESGEGIYFSGYLPCFYYTGYSEHFSNTAKIEDSGMTYYEFTKKWIIDNGKENWIYTMLQNMDTEYKESGNKLYIFGNTQKTQFYYFDGTNYYIYPNGSNGFGSNFQLTLIEFLDKFKSYVGITTSDYYATIYNKHKNEGFNFDNYAIICCNDGKHGDNFYSSCGLKYDGTNYYLDDKADFKPYCVIHKKGNFNNPDSYITGLTLQYTNDNYIKISFNPSSNSDIASLYELCNPCFFVDYYNSKSDKYDRKYFTQEELTKKLGVGYAKGVVYLPIDKLKSLSGLYSAGAHDNITVWGIGLYFAYVNKPDSEAAYFNFKNNNNITCSNAYYYNFEYGENVIIPSNEKLYRLDNKYQSWELLHENFPVDEQNNFITDGAGDSGYGDIDDNNNNNNGGTGAGTDFDITNLFSYLTNTFFSLIDLIGEVPSIISAVLGFLPAPVISLLSLSFTFLVVIAIVRYIRG